VENEVDVLCEEIQAPELCRTIKDFVLSLLEYLNIKAWDFSVTLCKDSRIAELNQQWRGKEGATDVLTFVLDEDDTFPSEDGFKHPGDIVISLERVAIQAKEYKQSPEKELKRLLVHGILHLSGLTHEDYDWTKGMLKQQEEILQEMDSIQISGWDNELV